jgi:hypothetical protein
MMERMFDLLHQHHYLFLKSKFEFEFRLKDGKSACQLRLRLCLRQLREAAVDPLVTKLTAHLWSKRDGGLCW